MKCYVKPCTNTNEKGKFYGNVCVSCYQLANDIKKGILNRRYHFHANVVHFIADNWRDILLNSEPIIEVNVGDIFTIVYRKEGKKDILIEISIDKIWKNESISWASFRYWHDGNWCYAKMHKSRLLHKKILAKKSNLLNYEKNRKENALRIRYNKNEKR